MKLIKSSNDVQELENGSEKQRNSDRAVPVNRTIFRSMRACES
jgi:hypothetical protein